MKRPSSAGPDLVVDEDWQERWYLDRLPADLCSAEVAGQMVQGVAGRKKAGHCCGSPPTCLLAEQSQVAQFPNYFRIGDNQLALHYRFHPGERDDGVSLDVPIHLLNAIDEVTARLAGAGPAGGESRRLDPRAAESHCAATTCRPRISPVRLPRPIRSRKPTAWPAVWRGFCSTSTGAPVTALDFNQDELDAHLRMNIRLADSDGRILAQSRDLPELKRQYADPGGKSLFQPSRAVFQPRSL